MKLFPYYFVIWLGLILFSTTVLAQEEDDLMDMFSDEETTDYTIATFKTTRLALGYSVENPAKQDLIFLISHHFGAVNTGFYEMFGLDQATIRIGFEYGITDRLMAGIGRSSYNKTYDGYLKYKVFRQSSGLKNMPVSVNAVVSMDYVTLKNEYPESDYFPTNRMNYLFQLLIARKFNKSFSLQIIPTLIHNNLVPTAEDKHDKLALGIGGRYKLNNRISVNAEYHYLFPNQVITKQVNNSLTLGMDIETGGHVFQLFFTNSVPLNPLDFIVNTTGNWSTGDVFFGFNITRTFTIGKKK
jgi:hypothetical protein